MSFLTLASLLILAGQANTVEVTSPFTLELEYQTQWGESVFVGADHPLLGNGDPTRAVKLSPHDYPRWSITLDLPEGTEFRPVFYLREDDFSRLADASNATLLEIWRPHLVTGPSTMPPHFPDVGNSPPARVETFAFNPQHFRERTIRVLLPKGYDPDKEGGYPLLLAQDGQNVFHPGGPFGSWDLDRTVTRLIDEKRIPPIILVGVDNTQDRFAEYIPNWGSLMGTDGRGTYFLAMIRGELIPELENRYNLAPGPENRTHLGSSLGGLLGWEAAHVYRETFGTVAALSPSFQIETEHILQMASSPPGSMSRLYIDSGTVGSTGDGYHNTMGVRDRLLQSGHALGPDFLHRVGLDMGHNEAAWRTRSQGVLLWIYNWPEFIARD